MPTTYLAHLLRSLDAITLPTHHPFPAEPRQLDDIDSRQSDEGSVEVVTSRAENERLEGELEALYTRVKALKDALQRADEGMKGALVEPLQPEMSTIAVCLPAHRFAQQHDASTQTAPPPSSSANQKKAIAHLRRQLFMAWGHEKKLICQMDDMMTTLRNERAAHQRARDDLDRVTMMLQKCKQRNTMSITERAASQAAQETERRDRQAASERDLATRDQTIHTQAEEIIRLESTVARVQFDAQTQDGALMEAERRVADLDESREAVGAEVETLCRVVEEAEVERKDWEGRVKDAEDRIKATSMDLAASRQREEELRHKAQAQPLELTKVEQQMKQQSIEQLSTTDWIQGKIRAFEEDISAARKKVQDAEEALKEAEEREGKALENLAALRSRESKFFP